MCEADLCGKHFCWSNLFWIPITDLDLQASNWDPFWFDWGMPLCDRFHQSQISHTRILRLSSYSRIRVLKATTARSPCRKIPKESMKAPFSQPRLLPGVGVEGADVLGKETTGNSAPPGPATSLSWEGMSAPLPAPIGQKNWTKNEVEAVAPQM